MNLLLLVAFAALTSAQNPLVKGKYRIEHPKLEGISEVEESLSSDAYFETFQFRNEKEFRNSWVTSELEIQDSKGNYVRAFPGSWKLESPYLIPGFIDDLSLVLGGSKKRSAIAHKLDNEINLQEGKLVIQYEVKLQKKLECGGAYIKLLKTEPNTDFLMYDFTNDDYQLIFGPDFCESFTDEIHLVLRRTSPITEESEDKILTAAPRSGLEKPISSLYTLILDATNQSFEIRFNGEVVKAGSLLVEGMFDPPLNPSKEIPDSSISKPLDWDDRPYIPDPNSVKPEDWDEPQPLWIPDPKWVKPPLWDESIPEYIPDPQYRKPIWWNDKTDGKWLAPLILNPSCYSAKGCGKWKTKLVKNVKYKGSWEPEMIHNPNYQGEWRPPNVKNPLYYEDRAPACLRGVNTIAFDIWSTVNDITFDNLYVGKSVEEAEYIGNKTFLPKLSLEKKEIAVEENNIRKGKIATPPLERDKEDNPNMFDQLVEDFVEWFLSIDDLYKGVVVSIVATIVIAITGVIIMKAVISLKEMDERATAKKTETETKKTGTSSEAVSTGMDTEKEQDITVRKNTSQE